MRSRGLTRSIRVCDAGDDNLHHFWLPCSLLLLGPLCRPVLSLPRPRGAPAIPPTQAAARAFVGLCRGRCLPAPGRASGAGPDAVLPAKTCLGLLPCARLDRLPRCLDTVLTGRAGPSALLVPTPPPSSDSSPGPSLPGLHSC